MRTIRLRSWAGFKALIFKQMTIPPAERVETWFRGLSDSRWLLQTTLDRFGPFLDKAARTAAADSLLAHFRKELIGLIPKGQSPEGLALELLARHHGLPSALMDWTESPYIAAFFAAQGALRSEAKAVAIWALNLGLLSAKAEIEPIRDREDLWFNPRALSQRGVFLRIEAEDGSAEGALDEALTKMVLPASECTMALQDLEAMNITARNLFRDLDGAARTAITRFQLERAEHD
jgi:hypothetical protein